MYKKLIAAACAVFACVNLAFAGSAFAACGNGAGYEAAITEFVAENSENMAALDVAVFDVDDVCYRGTFGFTDRENGIAADENSVFEWGSVTKLTVWTSVMQLCERGMLDLDTDVREYLPDGFLTNLRYETPVTLTNLMNHSAGFQETPVDIFTADHANVKSLADSLRAHEPVQIYAPGTVTAYSNWGCALAGYIVECVSGQSFSDYVHENIFAKLGMENTAILPDLSDNETVKARREGLVCYDAAGNSMGECFYEIGMYPCGMCTGTFDDFLAFARALLDRKPGGLFENAETYAEMFAPTSYYSGTDVPRNCHGLWMLPFATEAFGHGGNTAGCSSYIILDPANGKGMAIMTNQANELVFNGKMPELVFGEYAGSRFSELSTAKSEYALCPSRTVKEGPISLYNTGVTIMELFAPSTGEDDGFMVYNEADGVKKISAPYMDWFPLDFGTAALELAFPLLCAVLGLYAFVCLVSQGVAALVRVVQKRRAKHRAWKLWNALTCAALSLIAAGVLSLFLNLLSYSPSVDFAWQLLLFPVFGLALVVLAVYAAVRAEKAELTRGERVLGWVTAVASVLYVALILYFDLYQVWTL